MKYIALEEDIRPVAALKKSVRLTKGYRLKILEVVFAAILLNILGAICLLVGLLFTLPLTFIAFALVYKKLTAEAGKEEVPAAVPAEPVAPVIEVEAVPA